MNWNSTEGLLRNQVYNEILKAWESGESRKSLAERYGVTVERIRQIHDRQRRIRDARMFPVLYADESRLHQ